MDDQEIKQQLERLGSRLDQLERRLVALEPLTGARATAAPVQVVAPAAQAALTAPPVAVTVVAQPAPALPAPPQSAVQLKPKQSIEMLIGGKLLLWIGVIAVILAAGFFFALAVQRGWINITMRVIIGVCAGMGMLLLGELARGRKHPYWGQVVAGGGIALLYLSIFAAFHVYSLIGVYSAYAFMVVVTAASIALSVRYDALSIAILGLLGGFLTPVMLSTGKDNQIGLFSYILLLDLGILAIAWFKRWVTLDLLALLGTIGVFLGWMAEFYTAEKLGLTLLFLTIFFVLFSLLAFFNSMVRRKPADALGLITLCAAALWYYCVAVPLLWDDYEAWVGLFTAGLAVYSLLPALVAMRRAPEIRFLINVYLALAVVFLILAAPMQVDGQYVTIAWTIEGLALTWAGLRLDRPWLRRAAYLIGLLVIGRLLIFDSARLMYPGDEPLHALFNDRSLAFALALIGLALWAWLSDARRKIPAAEARSIRTTLVVAVCLLFVIWGSLEIHQHYSLNVAQLSAGNLAFVPNNYSEDKQALEHTMMLQLSGFYVLFCAALLGLGFALKRDLLRWLALALFGLTIVKVFVLDLSFLETIWRVLSFVVLGVVLIVTGLLYAVLRRRVEQHAPAENR